MKDILQKIKKQLSEHNPRYSFFAMNLILLVIALLILKDAIPSENINTLLQLCLLSFAIFSFDKYIYKLRAEKNYEAAVNLKISFLHLKDTINRLRSIFMLGPEMEGALIELEKDPEYNRIINDKEDKKFDKKAFAGYFKRLKKFSQQRIDLREKEIIFQATTNEKLPKKIHKLLNELQVAVSKEALKDYSFLEGEENIQKHFQMIYQSFNKENSFEKSLDEVLKKIDNQIEKYK